MPRTPLVLFLLAVGAPAAAQTVAVSRADYQSSSGARAIVSADFDRNGWSDVAHANFGRDSVTVLLNHRAGTNGLTASFEIPVGQAPFDMTSADFNLDGIADLAIANSEGNSLSILLGRGDGNFTRTDIAAAGSPRGIVAADMNHDGLADLIYSAYSANRVQILLGRGNGTFTAGTAIAGLGSRPQGVAAADFNQDGTLDLAVAYASAGRNLTIVSMAGGVATSVFQVPGPDNLNVVAVGDFDKDGWLDVAAASTAGNRLEIFSGAAAGLHHVATYSTGASPRGLESVDLNQDGALDLVTANRYGRSVSVFTNRADAPGSFDTAVFAAGNGSRAVEAADLNHDGRIDLVVGNQDAGSATVLYNETDLGRAGYALSAEQLPSPENYNENPMIVVDLNHNGIPDLAGDSYVLIDRTIVRPFPQFVMIRAAADLNGDGHIDLVGHDYNAPPRIWINDGRGNFSEGPFLPVPASFQSVSFADMNRDGRLDLIASTFSNTTNVGTIEVFLRSAAGGWASASRTTVPTWTLSVDAVDLNLDGRLDLVTTYYRPERVDVFLGAGAGRLGAPRSYPLSGYAVGVAIGDLNHDGAADVVVGGWVRLTVFTGSRTGTLTERHAIPGEAFYPKLADMNLDGHLDIVAGSASIFPGVGNGDFLPPDRFEIGTFHSTIVDFNRDGLPDFVSERLAIYNQRNAGNRPPTLRPLEDVSLDYRSQYGEEDYALFADASDPDLHALSYEWTNDAGEVVASSPSFPLRLPTGTHRLTVTVRDDRGGVASDSLLVTIRPTPEIVVRTNASYGWFYPFGSWEMVEDASAADGWTTHDPDAGVPKLAAPRANPTSYLYVGFVADPTQTYKLWLRGKADRNNWANDSVFLQFSGATDVHGTPVYRIGTTSGLDVNLEQCSGCGLSGWGWRDERWGPELTAQPVLLRFPEGGIQELRIQSREDGLSIDQIVLSADRYFTAPPGPPKNDSTFVPAYREFP
jgi:hypothetical protein